MIEDIGRGPVALDTSVFIFYVEEHPRFLPVVKPVFEAIDDRRLDAATSIVTLLEVLVVPYRANKMALADRYEDLLVDSRGLLLVEANVPLMRSAAQLRGATRMKTPDALQVAAALISGCTCLVTNDRDLPRLPGLRILKLRDYAAFPPSSVHEPRRVARRSLR